MGIDTRDPTMRQVLLLLSLSLACSAFDNPIQWLLDDLFDDQQYDSNIIPMKNVAKETGEGSVNLHLELKVINMDMDEAGFLSVNAWPTYQWTDYRLTWDPEQYRGISQIRVPASMVCRQTSGLTTGSPGTQSSTGVSARSGSPPAWSGDQTSLYTIRKTSMLRLISRRASLIFTMLSSTPLELCSGSRLSISKLTALGMMKF